MGTAKLPAMSSETPSDPFDTMWGRMAEDLSDQAYRLGRKLEGSACVLCGEDDGDFKPDREVFRHGEIRLALCDGCWEGLCELVSPADDGDLQDETSG